MFDMDTFLTIRSVMSDGCCHILVPAVPVRPDHKPSLLRSHVRPLALVNQWIASNLSGIISASPDSLYPLPHLSQFNCLMRNLPRAAAPDTGTD